MKHYTKIALLTLASLVLVAGCGKKEDRSTTSKTDIVETKQDVEKTSGETVEFFATGDYQVPTDIQPGSYYVVLTDMQYASDDEEQNAYVSIYVTDSSEESKFSETFVKEIGKPYRVNIEDGDKIKFDDNYSPTRWTVTFFTIDDYKEYQSSEKK